MEKDVKNTGGLNRDLQAYLVSLPVIFFLFIPNDSHWVPVHLST